MCGIAGFVGSGNYTLQLPAMLEAQKHRGPDFTGTFYDNNFAALGHNRLAIIDLTLSANQPFFDTSGRYVIVFNGEIYNYLELKEELKNDYDFETSSDTEVLLALYIKHKTACLNKLNGMFSFSVWDKKEKVLFAARDRFGIKPFYYSVKKNEFIFSSEIKAIHKAGVLKKPCQKIWINYFVNGSYGLPTETFWEDIYQLEAGHYIEYKNGNLELFKWYDFVERTNCFSKVKSYQEAKEVYKDLLIDSINLRFRSDVPIGFNLSGGLDSSALLALANVSQKHISKIEAFTFYSNDKNYDELPWVENMVKPYGNHLNKVLIESDEVPQLSNLISTNQDEPYGGIPTLAYSKIFQRASLKGIKVLLDGQGMDEQLIGYDYYTNNSNSIIQGMHKSPFRKNMLKSNLLGEASNFNYPKPFKTNVENLQFRDLFYTKIPRALRFNDRVSMMHSTELRVPFLDFRLIELGFSLPLEFKISKNQNKYILREIVSEYLGNDISYAPKRPLQTPQREWLGKDLKRFVENQLSNLKSNSYVMWFDEKEIDLEWSKFLEGDNRSSFHIWQLVNFSMLMT